MVKITSLKTFVVDAFRANYVFVKVFTDAGITGVGEGTVEGSELTVAQCIEEFGRYLVGRPAFESEHHVEMMNRDWYWRTGVIHRSAISALEAALLDIKGKALGVPVYELLGGRHRDRVPCYANAWFTGAREPAQFARKAEAALHLGFKALKWDPFGTAYLTMTRQERSRAVAIVAAVRDAVGKDIDLMIEGHGRLNVPTAVAMADELAPFRPYWFEEPIPPESIDALADVRTRSPIPIAAGERYYEPERFRELMDHGAVDFVQPDVCHVGGIGEMRKIAALAHMRFLPVAPHNPMGPIGNAMTLHVAASIPNFEMLETMASDVPWRSEVVKEDLVLVDGQMLIPERPGLGIDIDEEACARHPHRAYPLRHYIGTLTDIRPVSATPFFRIEQQSANA
jgi:galactonate dehydratase